MHPNQWQQKKTVQRQTQCLSIRTKIHCPWTEWRPKKNQKNQKRHLLPTRLVQA
jgi:hypothetical protein